MPLNTTMSPAPASVIDVRSRPSKPYSSMSCALRSVPSRCTSVTGMLRFTTPRLMRPMPMQADVGVVVEARHLQLQRPVDLDGRRRHVVDDGFEQRLHVAFARVGRSVDA